MALVIIPREQDIGTIILEPNMAANDLTISRKGSKSPWHLTWPEWNSPLSPSEPC